MGSAGNCLPFLLCRMSAHGTFRKCRSRCVMSAYRGRPEVIGEGSKRRDLPNADFKSFVLSVMKRTSDRAVMAVTCAHYNIPNIRNGDSLTIERSRCRGVNGEGA